MISCIMMSLLQNHVFNTSVISHNVFSNLSVDPDAAAFTVPPKSKARSHTVSAAPPSAAPPPEPQTQNQLAKLHRAPARSGICRATFRRQRALPANQRELSAVRRPAADHRRQRGALRRAGASQLHTRHPAGSMRPAGMLCKTRSARKTVCCRWRSGAVAQPSDARQVNHPDRLARLQPAAAAAGWQ